MIYAQFVNKILLLSFLIFATTFCCAENLPAQLNVEIAQTSAQKAWGLMGRRSLNQNHGMLFVYQPSEKMDFWMFNTFINLSIAFIDENNIIREMHFMKAYPEKMDPKRPVKQLSDLNQYSYFDTEMQFFRAHRVETADKYKYALEVNAGWFERNGVKIGDQIVLDEKNNILRFGRK